MRCRTHCTYATKPTSQPPALRTHRAVARLGQRQALHTKLGDVSARDAAVLGVGGDQIVIHIQHKLAFAARIIGQAAL